MNYSKIVNKKDIHVSKTLFVNVVYEKLKCIYCSKQYILGNNIKV